MNPVISSSPAIQADEAPVISRLIPALIGGVAGAALGAALWAGVGILTEYESTYVALAVGLFVGGGVRLLGGKATLLHQLIAVLLAVVGVLAGKYLIYYHFTYLAILEEFGQAAWDELAIPLFSGEMIQYFIEDLPSMTEFLDIVFIGLAMFMAWTIPASKNQEETAQELPAADESPEWAVSTDAERR